ncbi:MAG: polysaccharide deacetylase family protein [Cytophagaceae bacterium]|nr:polysaccharide deacetylase family protein [Cytophagaceae bacterium]
MPVFDARPARVPSFIKWWYPSWFIWDKPSSQKQVYLTFDDGPIPEVTPWVLDVLAQHQIKASFFCIGENVAKHPALYRRIIAEGHSVGNHSMHHLNGYKTSNEAYLDNIFQAEATMQKHSHRKPLDNHNLQFPLFRPPYGVIRKSQARALKKRGFTIVMYRVIGYDWEAKVRPQQCLDKILNTTRSGDLIVLHDSIKAAQNMKYTLARLIPHFKEQGYSFATL